MEVEKLQKKNFNNLSSFNGMPMLDEPIVLNSTNPFNLDYMCYLRVSMGRTQWFIPTNDW